MFGGNRLKNLEAEKDSAQWKADFWYRRWNDAQRELGESAGRVEKAEAEAALFKNDNEVLAEELDRLDADKTRLSDKLRQAKANAGDMAAEADRERDRANDAEAERDEWRDLYYKAAERADMAERFAAEDRMAREGAHNRAERAEASLRAANDNAEYWRKAYGNLSANVVTGKAEAGAVSRPMSEGGQRFAVVFRSIDGFTEHRRRETVHAADYPDAQGMAEELRRPCERVHSVEPMQ